MIVEDDHFAYLVAQKGSLDELKHDRAKWHHAYEALLQQDVSDLLRYFPVKSVLDIGSGLGGVDALINEANGGDVDVCLLDGVNDEPLMRLHRETFNNMAVASDFLHKNGVSKVSWEHPDDPQPRPSDLIISFGAWCFHFPPSAYLHFVCDSTKPEGTTIVLDVRRDKPEWMAELVRSFGKRDRIVRPLRKADRVAWRV